MPNIRVDYMLSQGTGAFGEPIRQSSWELILPEVPQVALIAVTCSLPTITVDPIPIHHFNEQLKIAGQPNFNNINVSIRDVVSPPMASFLYAWYQKVYNPESGEIGYASDYKKQGILQQFDTKGVLMRQWMMKGLWPTSINFGEGDYATKDPINVQLELSCDRAIPEFIAG